MRPRTVEEGVGQERPQFGPTTERVQISHRSRLFEGGGVGIRADKEVDRAGGPQGHRQPAGDKSEIADDQILDRRARPCEGRMDDDEQEGECDDDSGRVEHPFRARRRVRRFDCIHTFPSLSIDLRLKEISTIRKA